MQDNWKKEREILYPILQQLQVELKDKLILTSIMTALGFEDDVSFAKSLFSDQVAKIYSHHKGKFQTFISDTKIMRLDRQAKEILIAIFRIYNEKKVQQKCRDQFSLKSLRLPDENNVEQIIKFQKKMFNVFKELIPKQPESKERMETNHPSPNYPPLNQFSEQSFKGKGFENDYHQAYHYLPTYQNVYGQPAGYRANYSPYGMNPFNPDFKVNQHMINSPSVFQFSKYQANNLRRKQAIKNKGFSKYSENEELQKIEPTKKVKTLYYEQDKNEFDSNKLSSQHLKSTNSKKQESLEISSPSEQPSSLEDNQKNMSPNG